MSDQIFVTDAATRELGRARNKAWRRDFPQRYLWNHARTRARRKNLPFTITPEDIPLPKFCEVFGFELVYGTGTRPERDRSASVDRIEPAKGYVPGNIRVISFRANYLRSSGTLPEFEQICVWLRKVEQKHDVANQGDRSQRVRSAAGG